MIGVVVSLPVAVVLGAAFAAGIVLMFRYLFCWNRLEKYYLAHSPVVTEWIGLQGFRMSSPLDPFGLARSTATFFFGISKRGFVIRAVPPLSLAFRTLEIPWDQFTIAPTDYSELLPFEVNFSSVPRITMFISGNAAERLVAAGAKRLSFSVVAS